MAEPERPAEEDGRAEEAAGAEAHSRSSEEERQPAAPLNPLLDCIRLGAGQLPVLYRGVQLIDKGRLHCCGQSLRGDVQSLGDIIQKRLSWVAARLRGRIRRGPAECCKCQHDRADYQSVSKDSAHRGNSATGSLEDGKNLKPTGEHDPRRVFRGTPRLSSGLTVQNAPVAQSG